MKKSIFKLGLILILGMLVVSCGGKKEEKTEGGKKVVTVWAWDKNFNIAVMEEAKKRYASKNPNVEINVVDIANEDIRTKLQVSFSSGVTKGLPDIVLIEENHIQKFLTSYPGKFEPLNGKISHENFAQYKVQPMTLDGKTYGVPFDSGVAEFFYRRDMLEKAGYTAKDLENINWDKFIEIGKKLKEKTGIPIFSADYYTDMGTARMMMQSSGNWYFDEKGNVTIENNPALKESLIYMKKMYDAGIVGNQTSWGEYIGLLNSGKVAGTLTGAWIIGSIKSAADQEGKWGVASFPKLNLKNSKNASNLGGSSWYVLADAQSKEEAIEFLKEEFTNDNDFYGTILVNNGAIGTYLPAQSIKEYQVEDKFFGNQKIYEKFSKDMSEIPAISYGLYVDEADKILASLMKDYFDGKLTVEEVLKTAESQLKNQIK